MFGIMRGIARRLAKESRRAMAALPNPPYRDQQKLLRYVASAGIAQSLEYSDEKLKQRILTFVRAMHVRDYEYRYAPSSAAPTLYSSVYACLILSLFGELGGLGEEERRSWARYFDRFQSPDDGLFRDPAVGGMEFEAGDSWGGRHLALHMMAAYAALGRLPAHPFRFLSAVSDKELYEPQKLWQGDLLRSGEIDNRIMNVVCELQYERDFRGDAAAGERVVSLLRTLWLHRDPATGLWGKIDRTRAASLSRAVQFAYHLYAAYFYDGWPIDLPENVIDSVLLTQNSLGGYGVVDNSSACEDIDSVDLLCRLALLTDHREAEVALSLRRARVWMLANQNDDGGFVFRRNEPFLYGHRAMSSGKNESALFPTWFRALALARVSEWQKPGGFHFVDCPGLQFGSSRGPRLGRGALVQ